MLLWKLVVFWLSRQKSIISNYTFKPISFKISSWSLICRDVSKEVLIYLCSKQALKDLKNFISSMEEKYHLQSRKWIVFGGSYPGIVLLLVYNIFANFLLMRKIKWTFPIRFTFKYFFFRFTCSVVKVEISQFDWYGSVSIAPLLIAMLDFSGYFYYF